MDNSSIHSLRIVLNKEVWKKDCLREPVTVLVNQDKAMLDLSNGQLLLRKYIWIRCRLRKAN